MAAKTKCRPRLRRRRCQMAPPIHSTSAMRYGPNGDRKIFVPCPPADPNGPVNADAMDNDLFTGTDFTTSPPGFGGPETGFSHSGETHGNFESNPHDLVHGYVGGYVSGRNLRLDVGSGHRGLGSDLLPPSLQYRSNVGGLECERQSQSDQAEVA